MQVCVRERERLEVGRTVRVCVFKHIMSLCVCGGSAIDAQAARLVSSCICACICVVFIQLKPRVENMLTPRQPVCACVPERYHARLWRATVLWEKNPCSDPSDAYNV